MTCRRISSETMPVQLKQLSVGNRNNKARSQAQRFDRGGFSWVLQTRQSSALSLIPEVGSPPWHDTRHPSRVAFGVSDG